MLLGLVNNKLTIDGEQGIDSFVDEYKYLGTEFDAKLGLKYRCYL